MSWPLPRRSWRASGCGSTPKASKSASMCCCWCCPAFCSMPAVVYQLFHLYKGKWRFASLPDLLNIFRAVTVLAVSLLVLDYILVAPEHPAARSSSASSRSCSTGSSRCSSWAGRASPTAISVIRARASTRMAAESAPDPGARTRGRRRGAAARHRKRRGEEDLAGRHSVAVAGGSGSVGARRLRAWGRSTISRRWSPISRRADGPIARDRAHAVGARPGT